MATYRFLISALRPPRGALSKMVGAAALPQTGKRDDAVTQEQIVALQDQINALNTLARQIQQFVEVDGSALPFTPPGGSSGNIQINNGAGGFAALTQEAWTNVSTYANSWVDGAIVGDAVSGFRKDGMGNVWSRGTAKSGTTTDNTTVFTLPAGYRPTSPVRMPVTVLDNVTPDFIAAPAILRIGTDGAVSIWAAPVSTAYILFNFSFPNS